jgi:Spy/CpxP family protein refolding chaperone
LMTPIRFVGQTVILSLITVLIPTFVQAQPPGGGRGGFGGGRGGFNIDRAMLLRADQVRKELKIEEAQAATIDAALEAYREERNNAPRPDRDALANMSEEERAAASEKSQKEREELSRKTDEVLNALLEPEQSKRLDQISLQAKLSFATVQTLKSEELKSKLSLTDEQLTKLDDAGKAATAEMQEMFQGLRGGGGVGGGFEQIQEKMTAARAKSVEAAMAILTPDQAKTMEELKGTKFEIDMRALMGGRGGPQGRGDRGRGGDGGNGGGAGGRRTRPPAE